jgi:hypothetical protein
MILCLNVRNIIEDFNQSLFKKYNNVSFDSLCIYLQPEKVLLKIIVLRIGAYICVGYFPKIKMKH